MLPPVSLPLKNFLIDLGAACIADPICWEDFMDTKTSGGVNFFGLYKSQNKHRKSGIIVSIHNYIKFTYMWNFKMTFNPIANSKLVPHLLLSWKDL